MQLRAKFRKISIDKHLEIATPSKDVNKHQYPVFARTPTYQGFGFKLSFHNFQKVTSLDPTILEDLAFQLKNFEALDSYSDKGKPLKPLNKVDP